LAPFFLLIFGGATGDRYEPEQIGRVRADRCIGKPEQPIDGGAPFVVDETRNR
jgi:hypothetical protein